jgi:hypothetical protein
VRHPSQRSRSQHLTSCPNLRIFAMKPCPHVHDSQACGAFAVTSVTGQGFTSQASSIREILFNSDSHMTAAPPSFHCFIGSRARSSEGGLQCSVVFAARPPHVGGKRARQSRGGGCRLVECKCVQPLAPSLAAAFCLRFLVRGPGQGRGATSARYSEAARSPVPAARVPFRGGSGSAMSRGLALPGRRTAARSVSPITTDPSRLVQTRPGRPFPRVVSGSSFHLGRVHDLTKKPRPASRQGQASSTRNYSDFSAFARVESLTAPVRTHEEMFKSFTLNNRACTTHPTSAHQCTPEYPLCNFHVSTCPHVGDIPDVTFAMFPFIGKLQSVREARTNCFFRCLVCSPFIPLPAVGVSVPSPFRFLRTSRKPAQCRAHHREFPELPEAVPRKSAGGPVPICTVQHSVSQSQHRPDHDRARLPVRLQASHLLPLLGMSCGCTNGRKD